MDPRKKLTVLRDQWKDCTRCGLSKLREHHAVVFGAGSYNADFLLITESPTDTDVIDSLTLTGPEGRLVEDMLNEASIDPVNNVFRTSLVGCRAYTIIPATDEMEARVQDRGPDKVEVESCHPRLMEIIYLVDPRLIITMGEEPWKALIPAKNRGSTNTIARAAGNLFEAFVPGRVRMVRYPVMATLSPKQLVSNPSTAQHAPIATTMAAFLKAYQYVEFLKEEEKIK